MKDISPYATWKVNPRYAAYAKAHGHTPDEQMTHDHETWPGGVMCGFITWMNQQKQDFFKAHPEAFLDNWIICDQKAWSNWLNAVADAADAADAT